MKVKKNSWILVKSNFFEDNFSRAFRVKEDKQGLYIEHNDNTKTYLKDLPTHLYSVEDSKKYETDGEIFL